VLEGLRGENSVAELCRKEGINHCGGFVKQSAQLAITTSRDVAIIINFSRLEAPRCEAEPGTNRARLFEVVSLLERSGISDGGDRTNPRHSHEHATGRIALHQSDETTVKRGAVAARHLAYLKKWHDHCGDRCILRDQDTNVLFE